MHKLQALDLGYALSFIGRQSAIEANTYAFLLIRKSKCDITLNVLASWSF